MSTSRDPDPPEQDGAAERSGEPDPTSPSEGESGVRRVMSKRLAATLETWLDMEDGEGEGDDDDDIPGANVDIDDEDDEGDEGDDGDDDAPRAASAEGDDDGWVTLVGGGADYGSADFDRAVATVVDALPDLPPPPILDDDDDDEPPQPAAARSADDEERDDGWLDEIASPPEDSTELPALDLSKVRALRNRRETFSSSGAFAAVPDADDSDDEDGPDEDTPDDSAEDSADAPSEVAPPAEALRSQQERETPRVEIAVASLHPPRARADQSTDTPSGFASIPTRRDAEAPSDVGDPAAAAIEESDDEDDEVFVLSEADLAAGASPGTEDLFTGGAARLDLALGTEPEDAPLATEPGDDDSGVVSAAALQAAIEATSAPFEPETIEPDAIEPDDDDADPTLSEASEPELSVSTLMAADIEAALAQADQTHDGSEEIMRLAREVEADLPSLSAVRRERPSSDEDATPHMVFDSFPSGVLPGHDDDEDYTSGSYEFGATEPERAHASDASRATPTASGSLPAEAPDGGWDEDDLPEVEPLEGELPEVEPILGASAAYPLVEVMAPMVTRESEPVGELSVERAWEAPAPSSRLSIHNAKTSELPMEADLGEGAQPPPELIRYMRRLRDARPGPGGMGVPERRASATLPTRIPDVILSARIVRARPEADDDGRLHVLHDEIDLVRAVVESAAQCADVPVLLTGPAGSGKSHCLNTLCAALAEPFLDRGATVNAFAGMISPLQIHGMPVPVSLDLAPTATAELTSGAELLQTSIDAGELPEALLWYTGPVVVLADNLDLALSQGRPGYNPFALLRELVQANPSWRAIIAGRPQSFSRLMDLCEDAAEVRVIEIRPMRKSQSLAFVRGWQESQLPAPADQDLDRSVPAVLGTNPRLLEMLLGQWGRIADSVAIAVAEDGLVGATRLLLDAICVQVQSRSGTGTHRRDLRLLAQILSALRGEMLPVEEFHGLIEAGQLKEDIDSLLAGGVVELRMVRGGRTSGGLYFTHPLFREVLLAEQTVEELVQLGLSDGLADHAETLGEDVPAPLTSEDITRLLQVARSRARRLRPHLRSSLAHALAELLESQADAISLRRRPRLARLLAACILLSSALVRAGAEAPNLLEVRGGALTAVMEALARAGEDHLRDALARDWTTGSLSAVEGGSGLFPTPK